MSNVASGFDDGVFSPQQEEGNGSYPAQQNGHGRSGKVEAEDGSLRAHEGHHPSGKQAVEGVHVNTVHEGQDGRLCSEKTMQDDYDGVRTTQVEDSKNENLAAEEDSDSDKHGAQPDLKNIGELEGSADGLSVAKHGDQSCKQTLEEAFDEEEAESVISQENASSNSSALPELGKPIHAQTSDDSWVQDNLANYQDIVSQNKPDGLTDSTPLRMSEKRLPYNIELNQDSRNVGTDGRSDSSEECSDASKVTSIGTLREHIREDDGAYWTVGGSIDTTGQHRNEQKGVYGSPMMPSPKSTPACGSPGQQEAGHGSFINTDVFTEGGQLGRHPQSLDFSDNADTLGKMTACNNAGVDFKIDLSQSASNMQAPMLMISSDKNGSLLSGASYYKKQSGSVSKIGITSRFGSAVFSLVVFSVIISADEKRVAAGSTFYVKFSDYQAYNYLAALNLLSFLYSGAQIVLRAQARSSNILSSPVKRGALVYLCDQMLALLMISSSSSAATASELSRHGLHNIWPPACATWKLSLFCSRAEIAVAMSFVSFLFVLLSCFSSGYDLSSLLAE